MKTKLVSIIIPIYEVSKYLDKCIQSACDQTYENLEIILVDDGSPDDCPAKCDAWKKRDTRIKVIHKENGGLSDARNAGLDMATGKYVYFLDGDDYVEPGLIATVISHMKDDVGMVAFGYYQEEKKRTQKVIKNPGAYIFDTEESRTDFVLRTLLQYRIGWEAWGRFFRRDIIETYHLRFADNRIIFAEDLYFSLCYCAHINKIIYIPECLYHYTIRDNSIMGTDSSKINIGRMNELSKAVKAHYERSADCAALLKVFPIIHYFIVDNSIQQMMKAGCPTRELRKRIQENVRDYQYFTAQLKQFPKHKKTIYQITNSWKATDSLNTCRYILSGSYTALRIRNRLLSTYPEYFEKISAKETGIYAEYQQLPRAPKRFFLIGTEEFGNLGDSQIAESILHFLEKSFPDYCIKEITIRELSSHYALLKKNIRSDDLIALTGGGNFGDVYKPAHDLREKVIRTWPNNLKVIFPQTIHFTDTEQGRTELAKARRIYTKDNNVLLFTREGTSYQIAQAEFDCKSFLVPDIVLSENKTDDSCRGPHALFCFRSDEEKSIDAETIEQIKQMVNKSSMEIQYTDLQLDYCVDKKNRTTELAKAFAQWKNTKILFTDRLHGMIFAAITGTPCIVFSNYNHKVRGTYEWIKYLPYIRYAQSVEDVEVFLPELVAMKNCKFDGAPLMPYFDTLADTIRNNCP